LQNQRCVMPLRARIAASMPFSPAARQSSSSNNSSHSSKNLSHSFVRNNVRQVPNGRCYGTSGLPMDPTTQRVSSRRPRRVLFNVPGSEDKFIQKGGYPFLSHHPPTHTHTTSTWPCSNYFGLRRTCIWFRGWCRFEQEGCCPKEYRQDAKVDQLWSGRAERSN